MFKAGDKVILKGTKSKGDTDFNRFFKERKKGDIVTIKDIREYDGHIFVEKEECYEFSGALAPCDLCPLSWKDRFTQ